MSHKQAQPYSGKNPVPVITTKLTSLISPERATEAKAQQLQDASARDEQKNTRKTADRLSKGHAMHDVKDPTTGEELDIRNADEEPDVRSQGDNILHLEFPPPDWKEHREYVLSMTQSSVIYICLAFVASFAISATLSDWRWRLLFTIPPVFISYCLLFSMNRAAETDFEQRIWHAERMRGLGAASDVDRNGNVTDEERTKESAEWVNALVRGLWPTINSDLFRSLVDMLEDIMQSSVPAFIVCDDHPLARLMRLSSTVMRQHSVRIPDMGLGSNAGHITAIRSLPDARSREGDDSFAGLGVDPESITPEERDALDEDHVNLEVSFAYQGLPSGRAAQEKGQNIHFMVEFFLGVKNLWGFRVPVWVEVTGTVGTARAVRLQLIPDPPFVKTTLVTLMGLPRITISVVPMTLPNIMNLPFISGFISSAIDTAAAEYVAPKSMTLDLQRLISGDNVKKDTEAIGVVVIHIHRATGIKKMDTTGASDPYVTLTYSRLEKPLYSTRIIKCDLNPVFEEIAVLLVDVNTVKLREKISFQLWDSDRLSVDDMMGFAEIDLVDLIRHRGTPVRRVSSLSSPDSRTRPGSLEYTIGYYGKLSPNKTLSRDGSDPSIPDDLRGMEELKDARSVALNEVEAAVLVTPPDPKWPSGLLSMQVHEIRDLTVRTMGKERKGGSGREGEKGQDAGEETAEEDVGLPSSYCTLSLNDELVYETRAKPITSSPMFNAGTERFVRDWRAAHVAVTVKDSRMRENDAILGTVFLKLSETLVNASEVTRFYSLENGLGTGRIRISLLFRPIEAKFPPNLLGFDTGTLDIRSISVHDAALDLSHCEVRIKITTGGPEEKISYKTIDRCPDSSTRTLVWTPNSGTKLPVRQRYAAALLVSFRDKSAFKSSAGRKALAVLWLRDVVDRAEGAPVECALWRAGGGDYSRLKSSYVPPDGDLSYWVSDSDREKVDCVGRVRLDLSFWPGIAEKHYEMLDGHGARKRSSRDEYDRQKTGGLREKVGEMSVQTRAPLGGHRSMENQDMAEGEDHGQDPREQMTDTTRTGGSANVFESDSQDVLKVTEDHGVDTTVSPREVQVEGRDSEADAHGTTTSDGQDGHHSNVDEEGGETVSKRSLIGRAKDWRQHEKELHRDHRGVMQAKPMRTAEWIKDSVKDGVHTAKDRFKMKARHPDVETEV
ncbi:hypothetical protein LXA43DRAFT_972528 [Ganoderma leucocontextum]|nr:hypothetical protein LXA43DRAFT_972528 [Ganoderma leucocontextum]